MHKQLFDLDIVSEYLDALKTYEVAFNPFEELFIMLSMFVTLETRNPINNIKDYLEEIEFDSEDEGKKLVENYFIFFNSFAKVVEELGRRKDMTKSIKDLTALFNQLIDYYDAIDQLVDDLIKNATYILSNVCEEFDVFAPDSDEIRDDLDELYGVEFLDSIIYIDMNIQALKDGSEETIMVTSRILFVAVFRMVVAANEVRKKGFVKELPKAKLKPNDICFCGSGKKYKKCCMGR